MDINALLSIFPAYLITLLLFSYIIWSKFLNKNKLKPNTINEFIDFLGIFFFISSTLTISLFASTVFLQNVNSVFRFNDILDIWKTLMLLAGALLLLLLPAIKSSDNKFFKNFIGVFFLAQITITVFIAVATLTTFFSIYFINLVSIKILPWAIFSFIAVLINYFILKSFDGNSLKSFSKELFNIKTILILIIFIAASTIYSFNSFPSISKLGPTTESYKVFPEYGKIDVFAFESVNYTFNEKKLLTPTFSNIPIDYHENKYFFEPDKENDFELSIIDRVHNRTSFINGLYFFDDKNPYPVHQNNIISIYNSPADDVIFLIMNNTPQSINNISVIVMKGYKKINNADKIIYNRTQSCTDKECAINFQIGNRYDRPVYFMYQELLNFHDTSIKNITNCVFKSISVKSNTVFPNNITICELQRCEFNAPGTFLNQNSVIFSIRDERIWFDTATLNQPVEFEFNISSSCI